MTMKIKQVSTDALIPYALNSRRHSDKQVERIASSITEFGFNQPVVVDSNNVVIVGHGRLEAAKKLGLKQVPAIEVRNLTEAQIKAYRILDNKLQNESDWDFDFLQLEIESLKETDFDLETWELEAILPSDALGVTSLDEMPVLENGERNPYRQMTFTLHDEQFEEVEAALDRAKKKGHSQSSINENSNGNALAFVCGFFNRETDER
jgi:ParB family transcriptional regulator, chromosome partitioning protein